VAALFDAYVSGVVFGCVVLYEPPGEVPQGVAMIGESGGMPTIRSTSRGKTAHLWGIYMQPDHRTKRIGYHLMQASYKRLREMHFETMVSEVATSNATALAGVVAIGCSPTAIVHTIALGDCYGRDKRE